MSLNKRGMIILGVVVITIALECFNYGAAVAYDEYRKRQKPQPVNLELVQHGYVPRLEKE